MGKFPGMPFSHADRGLTVFLPPPPFDVFRGKCDALRQNLGSDPQDGNYGRSPAVEVRNSS